MSEDRNAQCQTAAIATVIKDDKYGYHSVAVEIRNIARNTALPTLLAPGWLEEPLVVQAPVVNVGHEYFLDIYHIYICVHAGSIYPDLRWVDPNSARSMARPWS